MTPPVQEAQTSFLASSFALAQPQPLQAVRKVNKIVGEGRNEMK